MQPAPHALCGVCPYGALVGGARQRRFDKTSFKPRKLLENAYAAKPGIARHVVGRQTHRLRISATIYMNPRANTIIVHVSGADSYHTT